MAPPPHSAHPVMHPVIREVTEDTPPDLLEGTMDLLVVLPNKKSVRMTVSRRTPMMDLLIQVATANKIVPGGHIVQVRNERGIELPYKPSTPIGALDTTTIEIVPKNQVNEYIIVKKQTAKLANQPFEQTFRLQVHLPRNQLYVMRVGPKTILEDILTEVCQEKNLDCTKYEMRHPVKLDEKLPLDRRLGDFGLQEVTVVSRNSRINSSVSTADIMALQHDEGRSKGCLDSAFKHSRSSVGDSSVSSESAASARGISPSRSDDSRSISPLPPARPKLKLNTTMSNASSSSGTSSSVPKSMQHQQLLLHAPTSSSSASSTLNKTSSTLNKTSSSALNRTPALNSPANNITATVQAPPRQKKRAAPQPPGLVSHHSLPPPCSSSTPIERNAINNSNNNNNTSGGGNITSNNRTQSLPSTPLSNIINNSSTVVSPPIRPTPRKKEPPRDPPGLTTKATSLPIHHSRHSSDSSGYHEACCDPHDNLTHRFDRQQSVPSIQNLSTLPPRVSGSVSVSNLTTVSSISSTSLASSNGGIRKRKAPRPPQAPSLQAQKELEEEISASTPSLITTTQITETKKVLSQEAPGRQNQEAPVRNYQEAPVRQNRKPPLLTPVTRQDTSVEEVEVEDDEPETQHRVKEITLTVSTKTKQETEEDEHQREKINKNKQSIEEITLLSQQPSLEETSLPPSLGSSSLSNTSNSNSNTYSSEGSTSSSPVPSPEGSSSTPTAAPSSQHSFESSSSGKSTKPDPKSEADFSSGVDRRNSSEVVANRKSSEVVANRKSSEVVANRESSEVVATGNSSEVVAGNSPEVVGPSSCCESSALFTTALDTMNRSSSSPNVVPVDGSSPAPPVVGRTNNSNAQAALSSSTSSTIVVADAPGTAPARKPRTVKPIAPRSSVPAAIADTSAVSNFVVNVVDGSDGRRHSEQQQQQQDGRSKNIAAAAGNPDQPKPKPRPRSTVIPPNLDVSKINSVTISGGNSSKSMSDLSGQSPPYYSSSGNNANNSRSSFVDDDDPTLDPLRTSKSLKSSDPPPPAVHQRNVIPVMSRVGIKVLPDNALEARLARLSKQENAAAVVVTAAAASNSSAKSSISSEMHDQKPTVLTTSTVQNDKTVLVPTLPRSESHQMTTVGGVGVVRKKARAPDPSNNNYSNNNAPPIIAATAATARSPEESTDPTTKSETKIQNRNTGRAFVNESDGSLINNNNVNDPGLEQGQTRLKEVRPLRPRLISRDSVTSGESDNLEENLELFELSPMGMSTLIQKDQTLIHQRGQQGQNNRIEIKKINTSTTNNTRAEAEVAPPIRKKRIAPTPTTNLNSPVKNNAAVTTPDVDRSASSSAINNSATHQNRLANLRNATATSLDDDSIGKDFEDIDDYDDFNADDPVSITGISDLTRTASDRRLPKKSNLYIKRTSNNSKTNKEAATKNTSKFVDHKIPSTDSISGGVPSSKKSLNRWQNLESLDRLESSSAAAATGAVGGQGAAANINNNTSAFSNNFNNHNIKKSSPLPPFAATTSTTTNSSKNAAGPRKKIIPVSPSEQLLLTSSSDSEDKDAHDIPDDSVLVSSESEASCTDSGIPHTETITPSPIDADFGRSEKDLLSGESSRRSSMHSIDRTGNTETLREILESKIQQEHEIIDKAFEGIDTDVLDIEDNDDVEEVVGENDEVNRKKSLNSNFDLMKPPSMMLESNASSPHPATDHTSDDERDAFSLSSHDEDEKELKFSVDSIDASASAGKKGPIISDPRMVGEERKTTTANTTTKSSPPARKLPKSESFSHNSEFDVVKMKRRIFSKEGKMSAVTKKAYDSSSDEDLGKSDNKKLLPSSSASPASSSKPNRAGSMQNLSSVSATSTSHASASAGVGFNHQVDPAIQRNNLNGVVNNRRNTPPSINSSGKEVSTRVRKATSVLNMQDLVDPDISQNPQLMASFQNELEAQIEQWKEQFIQRLMSGSKPNSFESDTLANADAPTVSPNNNSLDDPEQPKLSSTPIEHTPAAVVSDRTERSYNSPEQQQKQHTVIETKAEVHSEEQRQQVDEQFDSFDPEKPQIIHSVSSSVSHQQQQQQQLPEHHQAAISDEKIIDDHGGKIISDNRQALDASVASNTSETKEAVRQAGGADEDMPVITSDDSVKLREKKQPVEEERVYRYAGPPTIQMGTWGDRPQRSVSVKRDNDYIMGMGQHNPKTGAEAPVAMGSVAARINSYVSSQPSQTATLTRSSTAVTSNNFTGRPKSIAVMKPASIDSTQSTTGTLPKVLSSWQQKREQNKQLEENEQQQAKKIVTVGQSSFDSNDSTPARTAVIDSEKNLLTNSEKNSLANSEKNLVLTPEKTLVLNPDKKMGSESSSTSSTLERPRKLPAAAIFESNTLPPALKPGDGGGRRTFNFNNNNSNKSVDYEMDSASDYSSSSSRPNSSLSRAPSNASTSNITIGSMSDSTSSSPIPPSISLSEKKKFFQGIRPVESSKEAPIPAQNMKGNIATIQRVFEQRKFGNSNGNSFNGGSGASIATNGKGPSFVNSGKESTAVAPSSSSPSIIINNSSNGSSISSTMMVQKVMKAGSFNVDSFRRAPSPASPNNKSDDANNKEIYNFTAPQVNRNSTLQINNSNNKNSSEQQQQNTNSNASASSQFHNLKSPAQQFNNSSGSQQVYNSKNPTQQFNHSNNNNSNTSTQQSNNSASIKISPSTNRVSLSAFENRPVALSLEVNRKEDPAIKNVGNKSIIIVGSDDTDSSSNTNASTTNNSVGNNNNFRQKLKITSAPSPPSANQQQKPVHHQQPEPPKFEVKSTIVNSFRVQNNSGADGEKSSTAGSTTRPIEIIASNNNKSAAPERYPLRKAPSTPVITTAVAQNNTVDVPVSAGKVSSIAATLKSSNNGFFNSLQRPVKDSTGSHSNNNNNTNVSNDRPVIIKEVEKLTRKVSVEASNNGGPDNTFLVNNNISNNNNNTNAVKRNSMGAAAPVVATPVPPPPPMNLMEGVKLRSNPSNNNAAMSNGRPKSLSTQSSGGSRSLGSPNSDPRSEIFDAIKNSNGNFGLKKTGSTILLN